MAIGKEFAEGFIDQLERITGAPDGFFFWATIISRGKLFIDNLKLTGYRMHNLNISGARSHELKVRELEREIKTFKILISLVSSTNMEKNVSSVLKKWLKLYEDEYKLIALALEGGSRKLIATTIISLIKTGFKTGNTLKYRSIAFSILCIIDSRFARIVYEHIV